QTFAPGRGRAAEFHDGDFLQKSPQDLDAVAALRALAPRLHKRAVVVVVGRVLDLARRLVLYRHLHAALALVRVPDAVVETELHLLLDVAGEVVGRHPAGVDVKRRLAAVGVEVDHLHLHRIPRGAGGVTDKAALPSGADASQPPRGAEGEVD